MTLKIFQGKLEGEGRFCEILGKFLGEYFSNLISQTKPIQERGTKEQNAPELRSLCTQTEEDLGKMR